MISRTITELRDMDHGILLFLGSGKQGKSSALFAVSELFFPDRVKYIVDPYDFPAGIFPGYTRVSSLSEVPPDALIIMEDLSRIHSSRASSRDAKLSGQLSIISHRDNVILTSVQNTSSMDLEFFRSQRVLFFHKRMHESDLLFERSELASLQVSANLALNNAIVSRPDLNPLSFTFVSTYSEILSLPLVPWWSRTQSHFLREVAL